MSCSEPTPLTTATSPHLYCEHPIRLGCWRPRGEVSRRRMTGSDGDVGKWRPSGSWKERLVRPVYRIPRGGALERKYQVLRASCSSASPSGGRWSRSWTEARRSYVRTAHHGKLAKCRMTIRTLNAEVIYSKLTIIIPSATRGENYGKGRTYPDDFSSCTHIGTGGRGLEACTPP